LQLKALQFLKTHIISSLSVDLKSTAARIKNERSTNVIACSYCNTCDVESVGDGKQVSDKLFLRKQDTVVSSNINKGCL